MAAKPRQRKASTNVADLHRQWLQLVDTDGPFLAVAPLKRVWPQGIPSLDAERKDALLYARKDFETAWEALDRASEDEATLDGYRVARDKWVETVLRDVAGWAESLSWGTVPGVQAQSPNRAITVTAQAALMFPDGGIGALVTVIDPVESLRQKPNDLWAATPIDRMEALLRDNGIPIGIVTDGRWWGLVCAREGAMVASGVIDALTWIEEPRTRDGFLALIARQHIIGGEADERLPVLFAESIAAAEEITEALGAQVRRAVELLIQSFAESARDAQRRGEPDPLPTDTHDSYEAAVTIMMRIVFLLFAEERGLLPSGDLFEQGYGIAGSLDRLAARETAESEEALDATSMLWHRLLATSQALYGGASFENMRIPAYGGSLFDPTRFTFLTATNRNGTLAVTVSDRVMLHVLRSVQQAELKGGEARRISFRDIDVEQIGYIYEGLLGYTAVTVDETYLGLAGKKGEEPEVPLATLEHLAGEYRTPAKLAAAIRSWVEGDQPAATPQSAVAIAKAVTATVDPSVISALSPAVGDDAGLRDRVLPWLGLIRLDLRGRPVVVRPGGLMVQETPSRKNAGAHYTPRSLADEVVLHALQPLCYAPGPYQTADETAWKLKSSDEILDLKVADIACGSGAFLVSAARYLAERVVESWIAEDSANTARGNLYLRAVREVVANCIYGADINDMAVEMCKLSLWLVSLDRDLPFSFVDDKIFLGNSLLGLTSLDQLRKLHIDPSRVPAGEMFDIFDVDTDSIIGKATDLRRRLTSEIDENDPARNSTAKRRQLDQLHAVTAELRKIADGVIAAGLTLGGKPGKALDEAYENLRIAIKAAHPESGETDSNMLDAIIDRGLTPTVATDYRRWQPNHWVIEAPDVLVDRGGFDAVIGNPPFLRVSAQTAAMGQNVRNFVVEQVANGDRGMADFVAYFYRRSAQLVRTQNSSIGLIATNTIAQNHSSRVGISPLLDNGFNICWAIKSAPWPAQASFHYSLVVFARCDIPCAVLNGDSVARINAILEPANHPDGPIALVANDGLSFEGSKLNGEGFILSLDQVDSIVKKDPLSRDVIQPYLIADDLNGRPDQSPSRFVINFGTMAYPDARQYYAALEWVAEHVRPKRMRSKTKSDRDLWWQYARSRPALYSRLNTLERAIAIAAVSKYLSVSMCPTGIVFSNRLFVIADSSYSRFAVLASSIHEIWAREYSGSLEDRLLYTPTSAFHTFPFPHDANHLERTGERFERLRTLVLQSRNIGLTSLTNLINDPLHVDGDIQTLREALLQLDLAVMSAYGWQDIDLAHGFHTYRQMKRWTVSPAARVEILDRLLEENHRRAAAEAAARPKPARKGRRGQKVSEGQGTLIP